MTHVHKYATMSGMKITSAEFVKGIRGTDPIMYEPRPQVAFIGRSNVGKSSLINALLGRKDLVRSGKRPGKTTEINYFLINNSFYFVDLPGYGYAKLPQEMRDQIAKMIQWFFKEEVPARIAVLVLDIKVGPNAMDLEMFRILQETGTEIIVAANKVDALNQSEATLSLRTIKEKMPGATILPCSAEKKDGVPELLAAIVA